MTVAPMVAMKVAKKAVWKVAEMAVKKDWMGMMMVDESADKRVA